MTPSRSSLSAAARAAGHDVPDALGGIAGHHVVRDHLVVHDVRLELDALAAGALGVVDHAQRLVVLTLVVDADLGDHQGRMGSADCATAYPKLVHDPSPAPANASGTRFVAGSPALAFATANWPLTASRVPSSGP